MTITKGQAIKYAMLPGFLPRLKELFGSGFVYIAYMMAVLYHMLRLLPHGHPYLQPENFGKYGIRHVIAQAANNLVFDRKHLDQILLFFTILVGLVLLLIQVVLFFAVMIAQPAIAASAIDWVTTPSSFHNFGPEQDLAMILLDRIFGTTGIFNSCIATEVPCLNSQGEPFSDHIVSYPYPMHTALHHLLMMYSAGMAFVGAIIIIYLVTAIVTETIRAGTPFGQRMNKAWTLPRLIMFFALLAPINLGGPNAGLNAAQIITFWTAKAGSNLATNAWGNFNNVLTDTYLGEVDSLIAKPNVPDIGSLMQFMFVAKVCQIAEQTLYQNDIKMYAVRDPIEDPTHFDIMEGAPAYPDLLEFSSKGNIIFRFGEHDVEKYSSYMGNVYPTCGEMMLQVTDSFEPGSLAVQEDYYSLLIVMWQDDILQEYAECFVRTGLSIDTNTTCTPQPDQGLVDGNRAYYQGFIQDRLDVYVEEQVENGKWDVPPTLLEKGWAGAAIWYNRVAKMNGALTAAILNIPKAQTYPAVMEKIKEQRRAGQYESSGADRFSPALANGQIVRLNEKDLQVGTLLFKAYNFWETSNLDDSAKTSLSGNVFIDMINMILGTAGIYEMRKNADIHPLAQLSALGKAMIEATVRNALIALGGTVGEGLGGILGQLPKNVGKVVSTFAFTMSMTTLTMGVVLFYVVPFLPFVFFLFAVSGWVKSIFEAIVAMPLWALAHLHIDGEGLPGRAASNGYFLLFEIFLRPILIVFGLLASLTIFSALVIVLNQIFDLVVSNVGGFDMTCEADLGNCGRSDAAPSSIDFYRQPLDQFFFTSMYVVLVYVLALGCFKLIDQIPNNILRWMGVSVSTFQENAGDPASQLSTSIYKGTQITSSQLTGGSRLGQLIVGTA